MKKMSIGIPIFVGFLLILLLPATLIFVAKDAMTPPDGGVLTDCVVTDYVKAGKHVSANVDYVNSDAFKSGTLFRDERMANMEDDIEYD